VPDPIKLVFCLRRLPHLTREQFQHYWRTVHAPLVAERARVLGILRHVQAHALPDARAAALAGPRGAPASFDGVAELWFDASAPADPARREAARRAGAELLADERRFIDLAASPIFYTCEHEIVAGFVAQRAAGEPPTGP